MNAFPYCPTSAAIHENDKRMAEIRAAVDTHEGAIEFHRAAIVSLNNERATRWHYREHGIHPNPPTGCRATDPEAQIAASVEAHT